jgi:hypothetical protein
MRTSHASALAGQEDLRDKGRINGELSFRHSKIKHNFLAKTGY